jgi:hypothetical protein
MHKNTKEAVRIAHEIMDKAIERTTQNYVARHILENERHVVTWKLKYGRPYGDEHINF